MRSARSAARKPPIAHRRAVDHGGGIFQPPVQRNGVPQKARAAQVCGIAQEPLREARGSVPDTAKARPAQMQARLQRVAGHAGAVESGTPVRIAFGLCGDASTKMSRSASVQMKIRGGQRRLTRSTAQIARERGFMLRLQTGPCHHRTVQVGGERRGAGKVAGCHVCPGVRVATAAVGHVHAWRTGIGDGQRHRHFRRQD